MTDHSGAHSVLGAVMSAKVGALLPVSWSAAHLPAVTSAQLAAMKERGLGRRRAAGTWRLGPR